MDLKAFICECLSGQTALLGTKFLLNETVSSLWAQHPFLPDDFFHTTSWCSLKWIFKALYPVTLPSDQISMN